MMRMQFFYLTGDMGGDESFRPIFCSQSDIVEYPIKHPVFSAEFKYYCREEYLKDSVLNSS